MLPNRKGLTSVCVLRPDISILGSNISGSVTTKDSKSWREVLLGLIFLSAIFFINSLLDIKPPKPDVEVSPGSCPCTAVASFSNIDFMLIPFVLIL